MPTTSSITISFWGKFKTISGEFDGYLEHTGRLLMMLKRANEIDAFISKGDFVLLDPKTGKPSYNKYNEREYREYNSLEEVISNEKKDFNYLFKDAKWWLINDDGSLSRLNEVLKDNGISFYMSRGEKTG